MASLKEAPEAAGTNSVEVGPRSFAGPLAALLLEAKEPLTFSREGQTIGTFIPASLSQSAWDAAHPSGRADDDVMSELGMSGEELVESFKRWRKTGRP